MNAIIDWIPPLRAMGMRLYLEKESRSRSRQCSQPFHSIAVHRRWISIPVTDVRRLVVKRSERRFKQRMRMVCRRMTVEELRAKLSEGESTLIGESVTPKGPFER